MGRNESGALSELERRVTWVLLETGVGCVRELLDLLRQGPVANPGMRGESKGRGLPGCVVAQGLLSEGVESTRLDVTFDLVVPCRPVKFQEPRAKLRQLLGRQGLHLPFDVFNLADGSLR